MLIVNFICSGLLGRSTNFYAYAQNSPLSIKDPSGRILPAIPLIAPLLIRSTLGAVESVVFDAVFSVAEGKLPTVNGNIITATVADKIALIFHVGLVGSAVSGAITGPGTGAAKGT